MSHMNLSREPWPQLVGVVSRAVVGFNAGNEGIFKLVTRHVSGAKVEFTHQVHANLLFSDQVEPLQGFFGFLFNQRPQFKGIGNPSLVVAHIGHQETDVRPVGVVRGQLEEVFPLPTAVVGSCDGRTVDERPVIKFGLPP